MEMGEGGGVSKKMDGDLLLVVVAKKKNGAKISARNCNARLISSRPLASWFNAIV